MTTRLGSERYHISAEFAKLHSELDELVVKGLHAEAKKILLDRGHHHIPREFASAFADIAWRISQPLLALKILHHIIFPKNNFNQPATDQEKIIYASALINLGATQEALEIFSSVQENSRPEVLLKKALAHFTTWNYKESIPLLEKYIACNDIPFYKQLIGKVNLAAALIYQTCWQESKSLLLEIQEESERNGYTLLLGNCFELRAQVEIFQGHFNQALTWLEKSKECLKDEHGDFSLYAEKWISICQCFLSRSPEALQHLNAVKRKAASLLHWETLREIDLFESLIRQDAELAKKVIMGTPFESYRQRVRQLFDKSDQAMAPQNQLAQRGQYYLILGNSSTLDFTFAPYDKQNSGEALFEKPQLLALYEALTMDFYKPSHVGLLFERIYPEEKFDPFHSPDRVLQLLRRFNKWFIENKVPLRIHMKKSEFMLKAHGETTVQILISRAKKLSKEKGYLSQIKSLFKDRTFSTQQAAESLKVSRRLAKTIITQGLHAGQLIQQGTGRSTLYQLKTQTRVQKGQKVAA